MLKRKALITSITGQDGSCLAEFLLTKGYEVHGIKRRASSFNTQRIDHIYQDPHLDDRNLILHYGNLTDSSNLIRIILQVQPDEIYNLGAQSETLLGDPSKAKEKLGWVPQITLQEMVKEMVAYDLDQAKRLKLLKDHGFEVSHARE